MLQANFGGFLRGEYCSKNTQKVASKQQKEQTNAAAVSTTCSLFSTVLTLDPWSLYPDI